MTGESCKKDSRYLPLHKAASDFMRESQQHSQEEARDPDPDVEARQDFCSWM